MTYFAATMTGVALSAGFIFLLLRFFSSNSNQGNRARNISSHAFWTAVIAFFATGVTGLSNLWAQPGYTTYGEANWENRIMDAAAPGLWLGAIYIIGQFTWPRHLAPVRSASLEVRSVKQLVPKYLAGLLMLVTLLSSIAIAFAWNDPGAPHRAGSDQTNAQLQDYDSDENGNPVDEQGNPVDLTLYDQDGNLIVDEDHPRVSSIDGVLPGNHVGPYLAGGLALVLLSVTTASAVVVQRPPLQTLDTEENDILRRIWLNRLLRTALIIAAGFGAMSLQYLGQAASDRATWSESINHGGSDSFFGFELSTNWFLGCSTILMLATVLAMAVWPPPRLPRELSYTPHSGSPNSPAFSKARDFLFLMQGALFIALAIAGTFAAASTSSYESTTWETVIVDGQPVEELVHSSGPTRLDDFAGMVLPLALVAGAYLLLQLLANHVIKRRLGDSVELAAPARDLLPHWFTVIIGVGVALGLASIATFAVGTPSETAVVVAWMLGILGGTAILAILLYRAAANRPALEGASDYEDFQIRVTIAHRGARTLGGTGLIIAGILAGSNPFFAVPYADYMPEGGSPALTGLQIFILVVGAALCLLPASTAFSAYGNKPRQPLTRQP